MAVFLSDTFTDTDSTELTAHTPDTGGAWAALAFDAHGNETSLSDSVILGNVVTSPTTDNNRAYRNAATPASAEYDIDATVAMPSNRGAQRVKALFARMTSTNTAHDDVDYYEARNFRESAGTERYELISGIAGTRTVLDSLTEDDSGVMAWVFECYDATKRLVVDSVEKVTTTNNDITQVGRVGLSCSRSGGTVYIDNLVGDTVAAGDDHTLVPADIAQSQALDATTISQGHVLSPADIAQSQALDNTSITQGHVLAPADLAQAQTLDNTTVEEEGDQHTLSPDDIAQAQSLDSTSLTQGHVLVPADVVQAQSLDATTITQGHVLTPNDVGQSQSLDSTTVTQNHVLVPDDLTQAQSLDESSLTQGHVLSPEDLAQSQTLDNTTIDLSVQLFPADLTQSQSLDNTALTQGHVLVPDDLTQAQTLDSTEVSSGLAVLFYRLYRQEYYDEDDPEAESTPIILLEDNITDLDSLWNTVIGDTGVWRFILEANMSDGSILTSISDWYDIVALPANVCELEVTRVCSDFTVDWDPADEGVLFDLDVIVNGVAERLLTQTTETEYTWSAFHLTAPATARFILAVFFDDQLVLTTDSEEFVAVRDTSPACITDIVDEDCVSPWVDKAIADCGSPWEDKAIPECGDPWAPKVPSTGDWDYKSR